MHNCVLLTLFPVHWKVKLLRVHTRNVIHVLKLILNLVCQIFVIDTLLVLLRHCKLLLCGHMNRIFVFCTNKSTWAHSMNQTLHVISCLITILSTSQIRKASSSVLKSSLCLAIAQTLVNFWTLVVTLIHAIFNTLIVILLRIHIHHIMYIIGSLNASLTFAGAFVLGRRLMLLSHYVLQTWHFSLDIIHIMDIFWLTQTLSTLISHDC